MPLFLSDEEFRQCSGDSGLVAEKADAFIRELYSQIETVRAEADAASITLEQNASLIEQKYISLSAEYSTTRSQHEELKSSLEQRSSELGELQSEKQRLLLQSIEKDGEIERLTRESSELHKSKRQLMELLEQKDLEVSEKNSTIKSYLDKILNLSENVASKEARIGELQSELGRLQATSARVMQEKELLERHNTWLNEELTAKVDSLVKLRRENGDLEVDMSSKLADVEKKFKESTNSLKLHKDRARDLEEKLATVEKDLLATKDAAASAEERFSAEISTINKLVELYKASSEEWSKKAGELEGVVKALETHLKQVEEDYKDKLEKEASMRRSAEKECADLKEKLQTSQEQQEKLRKVSELHDLPLSSFTTSSALISIGTKENIGDDQAIVPRIPPGVSGTALAASLLRDGWPLAKMYAKYQEAVDALKHEQLGRKQTQAILERVLYEVEQKAGVILDEREEHERLIEAYSALDQKLHDSLSEHSVLETTIHELKANLKRQEREYGSARKEIVDLQKQVAVLLKECRDVQLRCGASAHDDDDQLVTGPVVPLNIESDAENIISERLLTFKDINGLVEQNVQLRSLVRNLSDQIADKETELKAKYEDELRKHTEQSTSRVNSVLSRAEEQAQMIESLHTSVAMYKKLYEEEHKHHAYSSHQQEAVPEQRSREVMLLHESTFDTSRKVQEQSFERLKSLEDDTAKYRSEIISLRAERDKLALEAQFAQGKLDRFMKEYDHQREEHNGVIARNVEFSQLIIDYQRKLRESAEAVKTSNELSQNLRMEVSLMKHEKEILQNSEKRASDEVRSLSERVYRLQASLDTIQSTEEVREEARAIERRKQEEYISKIEREWAEAKRELQEERDTVRNLTLDRASTLKNALRQVEELSKDLANALQSVAATESRAAVAEARCSDLEKIMEAARTKDSDGADPSSSISDKILANYQGEIEKLRKEAQDNNDHMLQYKSIAEVSEEALKQIESAYQNYKNEADEVKRSLEAELHSLKEHINELESACKLKADEAISASAGKEEALTEAMSEIARLKDDCSVKMSQIMVMEAQVSALKEDLEREHQRWRSAQDNYERQVILQSETIQELTKTSQALASTQDEASDLRKVVDELKSENNELKSRWETEKLSIEVYRNEADKKYNEVNELNRILHSRLEALHIKIADKEHGTASGSNSQNLADDGLQNIMNYLRRSKDIAETEISLLKQEKIRLQSQLELALKSAEEAQSHTERAKSQSSIFSEEEFKNIQLQVRELTLLRESNAQLREENRHNFEKSQKLHEAVVAATTVTENMEKRLKDRDSELEAYRKEIEMLKTEKGQLEKRIDELTEKCKEVDVDDYKRLKESCQQMEASLKEKDSQLEEMKKQLSEKHDAVSLLEQDLGRIRTELTEKETRINGILQTEASMKHEIEKVKRMNIQIRRKHDNMVKEKDELSKEVQSLSKQLEDAKQVKRNIPDSAGEQAQRDKEKEKDTRIHILERTLERYKEDLKKEKEDKDSKTHMLEKAQEQVREDLKKEKEDHRREKERRQKIKETIIKYREIMSDEKTKLSNELLKHRQALMALQDEVEKLKSSGGSQSESSSAIQHSSITMLDDFASAYYRAVENFEQAAQPACAELNPATPNTQDNAPSLGQAASSSIQTSAIPASNVPSMKANEDKERKPPVAKANVKVGRKLVRPNIARPKEQPQGDAEMTEADESQNAEVQGSVAVQTAAPVRKRSSASLSSDMQEETCAPEEISSDTPAPQLKKPKGSETVQEESEEQPATTKQPEAVATEEASEDAGGSLQQDVSKGEAADVEKDEFETSVEQTEEPVVDEQIQVEMLNETEIGDENLDKPSETMLSDDQLRDQTEQDIQQIVTELGGEKEEGELVADFGDTDADGANETGGTGNEEFQGEQSVDLEISPSTEPLDQAGLEAGEIDPSPEEDKNVDLAENITDSSNKVTDGTDPVTEAAPATGSTAITEEASTSTAVDAGSSEQGGSTPPQDAAGTKPVSPASGISSTTINLQERARQRAHIRQAAMAASSTAGRSRGRTIRGRGARGGRPGRGQSSGQ